MLLHSEIEANAVIPFLRTIVVKRLIEKYNLTQQQAAAKLGITQATISTVSYTHLTLPTNREV